MIEFLRDISKDELVGEVKKFADQKARFMIGFCCDLGEKLEATYCFNHTPGMDMKALRITVGKDEVVPSISGIYLAAVLSENEMQEQYGMKIKDIAIDFGGHMFLAHDSPKTPMLKEKIVDLKGSE